jgi:hypothetical protein
MKNLLLPALLLAYFTHIGAQNTADALRYAALNPGSTARVAAVGGAFTALGADFSSASINPAGIAMFRSDEMMFTPGLRFSNTDANFNGNTSNDRANRFNFGNLGIVFNSNRSEKRKWRTFNVGIGYNQVANFRQNVYWEGNSGGTLLNGWFAEAESALLAGADPQSLYPLGARLGYNAGAIYFQNGVPSYDFVDDPNALVDRNQQVETYGASNELSMTFAGNYQDRLNIGFSVGMPIVNYRQEAAYQELDPTGGFQGNVPFFDRLTYTDFVRTSGVGFNAKLGVTFRLNQMIRIGGAYHTPTFYNLTDNFGATFDYTYVDLTNSGAEQVVSGDDQADAEPFAYSLTTPGRANFGAAFVIGKNGFISGDVEWIDYSSSRFNLTKNFNDDFTRALERNLNNAMARDFRAVLNYRVGAEIAIDVFRIRGGVNLLGKPGETDNGFNTGLSFGGGLRFDRFYLDLAVRQRTATGAVQPYTGDNAPKATTEAVNRDVMMTVGFRF